MMIGGASKKGTYFKITQIGASFHLCHSRM